MYCYVFKTVFMRHVSALLLACCDLSAFYLSDFRESHVVFFFFDNSSPILQDGATGKYKDKAKIDEITLIKLNIFSKNHQNN